MSTQNQPTPEAIRFQAMLNQAAELALAGQGRPQPLTHERIIAANIARCRQLAEITRRNAELIASSQVARAIRQAG